jgi:hypothetical protein
VHLPPMPWRVFAIVTLIGVLGGAIVGFILGLGYLPTLPFAVIEGALLIGIPAAALGLLLTGVVEAGRRLRLG